MTPRETRFEANREGAVQDLLQQTRQLKVRMVRFDRRAREVLGSLAEIPDAEVEAMITREANVLGALECLLADDFEPALKKLAELDGLLE